MFWKCISHSFVRCGKTYGREEGRKEGLCAPKFFHGKNEVICSRLSGSLILLRCFIPNLGHLHNIAFNLLSGPSGDFAGAKNILEKILSIFPTDAIAQYNLACAEAQMGHKKEALEALGKAIESKQDLLFFFFLFVVKADIKI